MLTGRWPKPNFRPRRPRIQPSALGRLALMSLIRVDLDGSMLSNSTGARWLVSAIFCQCVARRGVITRVRGELEADEAG